LNCLCLCSELVFTYYLCSAMTDKNRQKKEAEGDQKMKEADKMYNDL
jgi:hypothetical protein